MQIHSYTTIHTKRCDSTDRCQFCWRANGGPTLYYDWGGIDLINTMKDLKCRLDHCNG